MATVNGRCRANWLPDAGRGAGVAFGLLRGVDLLDADRAHLVLGDARRWIERRVGQVVGGVLLELDERNEHLSRTLAFGVGGAALQIATAGQEPNPLAVPDAIRLSVLCADGEKGSSDPPAQ